MADKSVRQRSVSRVWDVVTRPGGGPHIQVGQVLPPGNWEEFDPFLMMAEDWFQQGTFPFHPHRGIETVTFVIDGKLKHEDNHGGVGVLEPGDVQWMTAGKGIIHSEDPLPGETVHSLQLWVNLPRKKKMTDPRYQDLRAKDMPVRQGQGASVKVFSGSSENIKAKTLNHVPVTYVEVVLQAGESVTQDLPGTYNGFIYILEGSGYFGKDETRGEQKQVLWLGSQKEQNDSEITFHADQPLRAILVAGEPIREPVVARGPFVMNTEQEIQEAFTDYQSGKFGPPRTN
ncbi:pirin family protein [Alkalihalobacillus sp. AL-G]|uniref:pirin family protein n=1 Tax=Alkalihalobacillus sp. AL-G TaxID=2926399 RepID=UPI00272A9AC3|nr:pirin family protein [Alkalihalobacillus sp. AL-G]WLD91688.1 pirin family protein [Alkalihalobacillus sp. AL-G]